ncbi:MAG: GGDEF domain-containing protein [Fervidobacterium sp.]|uniref:GGDEF domain-containing protein n=1 Tax=Fervidobacterium sp. TaxID=1871331 RepID=UPI00404A52E9
MIAQELKKLATISILLLTGFIIVMSLILAYNLKVSFQQEVTSFGNLVDAVLDYDKTNLRKSVNRILSHLVVPQDTAVYDIKREELKELFKSLGFSFIAMLDQNGLLYYETLNGDITFDAQKYLSTLNIKTIDNVDYFFTNPSSSLPVDVFVFNLDEKISKIFTNSSHNSFLILGRVWKVSDFVEFENMTGSSVAFSDKPLSSTFRYLVYSKELRDESGNIVGYAVFKRHAVFLSRYLLFSFLLLSMSVGFTLFVFLLFYNRLHKLALSPFGDIIYAIDNHTPDTIEKYIYRNDEIGNLARTVKNYLLQKEQINLYLKELESKNVSLRTLNEQIRMMLEKDMLTGLLTRYVFNNQIERLYVTSKADKMPLSAIYIDADNFKKINDTFGHNTGDEVLKGIADVVLKSVRTSDFPIRMGGEEILILLPEADINAAYSIAERIRIRVEERFKDKPYKVTVSLGVSQLKGEDTIESFLKRCDEALYVSKENGKNRTTVL